MSDEPDCVHASIGSHIKRGFQPVATPFIKMRTSRYLMVLFCIICVSCSNDHEETIRQSILGKWKWIESNGGFTGDVHYTPENTGEERLRQFNANGTVNFITNSDTESHTYTITREKSLLFGDEFDFLTINYQYNVRDSVINLPMRYMIRSVSNELVLQEDVYDGFVHRFKRIRN